MRECRTTMPGLNLISENYLDLAFVLPTDVDPWLHDLIDGQRKLSAGREGSRQGLAGNVSRSPEWTDIIHCIQNVLNVKSPHERIAYRIRRGCEGRLPHQR